MALDPAAADSMASAAVVWGEERVRVAIDAVHQAGFDEMMFVPTTIDPVELERLEPIL
jgi:hypothetical protein